MRIFNYYREGKPVAGFELNQKKHKLPFETTTDEVIKNYEQIKKELNPDKCEEILGEIKYAPAVLFPQKILCIGLNYSDHADELREQKLTVPTVFGKFNNALSAHEEEVKLPYAGGKYDYEAELTVVIGKECNNITKDTADEYIFGYTVGNDMSVREVQKATTQWILGKSFDKFAPLGPSIVTKDSIDVSSLTIQSRVNGELRQNSNTKNMIFTCAEIVSHIAQYMTLLPGDVILTGTPAGVIAGYPEDKQIWLKSGDRVDIEIENIGTLTTFLK
ncbi:MAG: fumarylacetoacetate hydrolase family protein [Clostridia bacterium]|nr:fumarylacetoacetate hydrolase family protein [Clostridia bacterium]